MFYKTLILIISVLSFSFAVDPSEVVLMSDCNSDSQDIVVLFLDNHMGFFNIKDTGSCLVYIKNFNVYYLTKRDDESRRIEGDDWKLVDKECIKRIEQPNE